MQIYRMKKTVLFHQTVPISVSHSSTCCYISCKAKLDSNFSTNIRCMHNEETRDTPKSSADLKELLWETKVKFLVGMILLLLVLCHKSRSCCCANVSLSSWFIRINFGTGINLIFV